MQRSAAEEVVRHLAQASGRIAETIESIRGNVPDDEFKRYTKVVGDILGAIYLDLLRPICREYPDLDPGKPS
jgi:hypothetical protein